MKNKLETICGRPGTDLANRVISLSFYCLSLEKVRAFSLRNCQPSFSMALLGPHLALLVNSSKSKFLKHLFMDMIKINVWD